jgi:hypothetical protein
LLAFPDFEDVFHVCTGASQRQLGAAIVQKDRPLAFRSRKPSEAQGRCATGEKELLSIVETLKEFKNILLGQNIVTRTDRENLLCERMASGRVMRWRLPVEEHGPLWEHVKGQKNAVADALSRLDADFDQERIETGDSNDAPQQAVAMTFVPQDEEKETEFPLSPGAIAKEQRKDKVLRKKLMTQGCDARVTEGIEVTMQR